MMCKEKFLSSEQCQLLTKRFLQSDQFKVLKYDETKFHLKSADSSNEYCSIKLTIFSNNVQSTLKFLAKKCGNALKNDFSKEIFAYETIFSERSFNSNFAPKCYYFEGNDLIIFEDLFEQGFASPTTIELDHIKLTLKTLAKYHAGSIGFKEHKSKKLGKEYKLNEESTFTKPETFDDSWFERKFKALDLMIDLLPQGKLDREEFKKRIHYSKDLLKSQTKFRNVLCHGYVCSKNILFKCDENGAPLECKLINFEFQHYNPPALDVLLFLYMETNQEFRKHHLHDLLQFYYDCFKIELEAEHLDADKILPKEEDFELTIHHFLPLVKLQTTCLRYAHYLHQNPRSSKSLQQDEDFQKLITEPLMELQNLMAQPGLSIEDCFLIIRNKIGTTNYQLLNYKITPLGEISGYLGDHNKLNIQISVDGKTKILHLFAKFMPKASAAIGIVMDTKAFKKETFFYQQLFPMIRNAGVNIIDDCVVPCYFIRYHDVMVFEDFGSLGYKTLDPRKPFSFEVMKIIIKKLAKFHASTILIEEKTKTDLNIKEHFANELQEGLFTLAENHCGGQEMKVGFDTVEIELELFPDPDFPDGVEMRSKIKKAIEMLYELVKPSKKFRNVVCHGDLWINNIMVQIKEDRVTDGRFIDFQVARYCPPAHDLLIFIYLTTNRSVRRLHFSELVDLYYSELAENLEVYGYAIDEIYPRGIFMESIEYMMPQAVCQMVVYYQTALINSEILGEHMADEESAHNVLLGDRSNFIRDMANRDPIFVERAKESLQDLREMCNKYF